MRIGIDARFLTHPQHGGFKSYTENLVRALSKIDQTNEYILFLDREPKDLSNIPTQPNFSYRILPVANTSFGVIFREQISLPRSCSQEQVDILHSPCLTAPIFSRTPVLVTIHDMIWYYPYRYSSSSKLMINKRKLMEGYYRVVVHAASRQAKAIITVSNASKRKIIDILGTPSNLVHITLEASNPIYHHIGDSKLIKSKRREYDLPPRYILSLGSADPRKNVSALIKAYALLPEKERRNCNLVIVWNHPDLQSETYKLVSNLGIQENVIFTNAVSDEDLLYLYNGASLFVFPSLEEGFGLPPLEAMACGTPVIAANNSSIPEIVGTAALLFDGENVEELSKRILEVITNSDVQMELTKKGKIRAAQFSWKKCASETLEIYKRVANYNRYE